MKSQHKTVRKEAGRLAHAHIDIPSVNCVFSLHGFIAYSASVCVCVRTCISKMEQCGENINKLTELLLIKP